MKNEDLLAEMEELVEAGNLMKTLDLIEEYQCDSSKSMNAVYEVFARIPKKEVRRTFFQESAFFSHLIVQGRLSLPVVGWTAIDPLVYDCIEIKELWLMGNEIAEISPEIRRLENLQTLRLNGNHLKTLPPEICFLKKLYHLELWGNPLESLPEEILQMKNLRTLRIEGIGTTTSGHRNFASWGPYVTEEYRFNSLNGRVKLLPRKYRRSEVEAHYAFRKEDR